MLDDQTVTNACQKHLPGLDDDILDYIAGLLQDQSEEILSGDDDDRAAARHR